MYIKLKNYHTTVYINYRRFCILGCTCKDMFITDRSTGLIIGNCRVESRTGSPPIVTDALICFVNTPTTCKDEQPSLDFPGLISSASACDSGKH